MSGQAFSGAAIAARPIQGGRERPGASAAVGVAVLCVLALAAVWVVAQLVPAVHLRDAVALRDFTLLSRPQVDSVANFLITLLDPLLFTIWALALVAVALARSRPRIAAAVAAVMALAPFTAETLKPLLAHPHAQVGAVHIGPASWPSGHSTAALIVVLCAVLVAPPRLRPVVGVLGALFALAVGCSLLILAWHMPSDVLGGYLVATFWMAIAIAVLRFADRHWPARRQPGDAARAPAPDPRPR
ncbi:MAG TPA: phosphatase PAP2 family protein [Solirubrobacteraceae bacterium]|jgi:membrane-associated phospholipid phosphatase|nr:phosphatase PAP2 family protein [Solirubrobacteraceae bacterium]